MAVLTVVQQLHSGLQLSVEVYKSAGRPRSVADSDFRGRPTSECRILPSRKKHHPARLTYPTILAFRCRWMTRCQSRICSPMLLGARRVPWGRKLLLQLKGDCSENY